MYIVFGHLKFDSFESTICEGQKQTRDYELEHNVANCCKDESMISMVLVIHSAEVNAPYLKSKIYGIRVP